MADEIVESNALSHDVPTRCSVIQRQPGSSVEVVDLLGLDKRDLLIRTNIILFRKSSELSAVAISGYAAPFLEISGRYRLHRRSSDGREKYRDNAAS